MRKKNILGFTVLALLILNIVSLLYVQNRISEATNQRHFTALAVGTTSLCINTPPSDIDLGTCNFTMPEGTPIACYINFTDAENNSVYFQSSFLTSTNIFNVSSTGYINTTINSSAIGNHTLRIIATDLSGCSNNIYSEDFNVEVIDSNHAPYLALDIPNQSIRWETSYTFFLNNYFADSDGDVLTYIFSKEDNLTQINIDNTSGQTIIKGLECGTSFFFFIATDPDGLTATSNTVKYTVTNCPVESGSSSGSGGGGGGGGGSYFDCTPDWRCAKWGACQLNGTTELKCVDYNGCDPYDYIRYFIKNCTYVPEEYLCEEKWECTDWSICINSTHKRTCLDKNSCGTTNNKPKENESCTPISSCFNGIRDGDETEIDCGGICGVCNALETPTQITKKIDSRIIIAAIITILSLVLVVFALRRQIRDIINSIISKTKRKKQPIYLTDIQKQKLLNIAFKMQEYLDNNEEVNISLAIQQFIQLFFIELLSIESPTKENIHKKLPNLRNKQLEVILSDFYKKHSAFKKTSKIHLQELIDEIFSNIYLVSEFLEKDALVLTKEREINAKEDLEIFYQKLSNIHIALEFKELMEAKNLYKDLLENYNKLTHDEKQEVYNDMMIVYNTIIYLERFYV